jgi:UDP-N-acetylglucosamine 2-epimerase (non-hydrolysing)
VKILSVVGARPQFVKLGPMHSAIAAAGHEHVIVHTGQHYDYGMSDVFFRDLGIPNPDENLEVGSGSHGWQTGHMLERLERSLQAHKPDWVLVYGDTNSTLAAAIAAVKLHLPLAHLEAGLRSFNRRMPEEHNRVLTDHASDLLLAPTLTALNHLKAEGLGHRTVIVGDVMTDVCLKTRTLIELTAPEMPAEWHEEHDYVVSTIHRQENTDDPVQLEAILSHLTNSALRVHLLAHPRLKSKANEFGIHLSRPNIHVFDPIAYPQLVYAVSRSVGVVTDSGGLQKEALILGVPCITLRTETEWIESVECGWNIVDPEFKVSIDTFFGSLRTPAPSIYGDGHAAERIVQILEEGL